MTTDTSAAWPARLTLDADQALAWVDSHFRPDAAATLCLRATLAELLDAAGDWTQIAAAHRPGRTFSRCDALVRPAGNFDALRAVLLDQPGDVLLLRLGEGRYALLHRHGRPEWSAVGIDGSAEPLPAAPPAFAAAALLTVPADTRDASPGSARGYLRWLIGEAWAEAGLASLMINAGQLLLPLFSMLMYNKIINNGVFATLWALALGMLIYIATDAALRTIRAWTVERLAKDLAQRDDMRLWHRLAGAGSDPRPGIAPLLSHYRDLAVGREFISSSYILALADLPFLSLYLVTIALVSWQIGLLTAALAGLYYLLCRELHERLTQASRGAEQAMTRKMAALGSLVAASDLLRTRRQQPFLRRLWIEAGARANAAELRRRLLHSAVGTTASVVAPLATVAILVLGAYLVEARSSNIGALIACTMLASRCLSGISSLFAVLAKWQDFERASSRFENDVAPPHSDPGQASIPLARIDGNLQVLDATKAYADRPPVLARVSLRVAAGEHVALLGKPGAGKTTLLRALAGLVPLDGGRILYEGAAVHAIDSGDRSRWIAFKGQEPVVFPGTLLDNIQAQNPALLERALWLSGLDEDIRNGRLNLGTVLSEGGGNLSGGQRQRVALARVFAQDARVFLLDEPGAGLDPDSERQLAQRLAQALGEATLIVVTHSPALIDVVDRLVVLDGGRIAVDRPKGEVFPAGNDAAA